MHPELAWLRNAQLALLPPLTLPKDAPPCPYCNHPHPHRWGTRTRTVDDLCGKITLTVQRYRCRACRRTFTVAPDGVDRTRRTKRLQQWHGFLWARGNSVRFICFGERFAWGWSCSRMAVWRDIRRQAYSLQGATYASEATDWLGVDGFGLGRWGGVVAALSATSGQLVAWCWAQETTPEAWVGELAAAMRACGATGMVTDDLGVYREVARQQYWERSVCWYHWRRWVGRSLRALEDELPASGRALVAQVRRIVRELPADGAALLWALWRQVPVRRVWGQRASPWLRLREVIRRLASGWEAYRRAASGGVPRTTGWVESWIGRVRVRGRWARGLKSVVGWWSVGVWMAAVRGSGSWE
jgi:hypothetical protein